MEIRQLTTFVMIGKLGSFTKAADVLGYSQSAVTMQMKALEGAMGIRLFERVGRTLKLTGEGESFFWYANQIVNLAKEAQHISIEGKPPVGRITIGTPESLCMCYLPSLIRTYRKRYPGVDIKVVFGTCCELRDMLQSNAIDLTFFLDDAIEDENLIVEILFEEPVFLVVSPKHPLAQKSKVTAVELNGQDFILVEAGCSYRSKLDHMINKQKVHVCSTLEASGIAMVKKFAKDNLGVALLSRCGVKEELAAQELKQLLWEGPSFDVKAQLLYHKGKVITPALREFIELVRETMKDEGHQII